VVPTLGDHQLTAVNLCAAEAVAEAPVVAGERCGSAAGRPVSSGKEWGGAHARPVFGMFGMFAYFPCGVFPCHTRTLDPFTCPLLFSSLRFLYNIPNIPNMAKKAAPAFAPSPPAFVPSPSLPDFVSLTHANVPSK